MLPKDRTEFPAIQDCEGICAIVAIDTHAFKSEVPEGAGHAESINKVMDALAREGHE